MRKKTLAAFAAVYTVICLTYGIIHGTNLPSSSETEYVSETAVAETEAETQTTTVTTTSPEIAEGYSSEEEETSEEVTTQRRRSREQTSTEVPETTVTEAPETYFETEPETEQIEEETEAAYVPSLNEYLQGLRCNGCRHNCSLANPRCMNGARKASQAESEYYSLYG